MEPALMEMLSSKSNYSVLFWDYYNSITVMEDRLAKLWNKDKQRSSSPRQKLEIPFHYRGSNSLCKDFHGLCDIHQWWPLIFSISFSAFPSQ